jgi:uncharacterized protein YndB with AHSA1/START domain
MADSFELSDTIPASPDRIYRAWLDSGEHGAMTGGPASADGNIGGSFNIMDGYITGTNLSLEPGRRIVQAWRTKDFPDGAPDSRLEIELSSSGAGTLIRLRHTEIPDGQGSDYEDGWRKYYFDPMRKYFGGAPPSTGFETARTPAIAMPPADEWEPAEEERREDDVTPAPKKAKAKKPAAKKPAAKKAAAKKAAPKKAAAKKPAKKKAAPKKKAAAKKKAAPKKKAAAKKKAAPKKKAKKKGQRR